MKKLLVIGMVVLGCVVTAQALTLAEAKGGLGEAINNPEKLTATISQLSAADQRAYVAAMNASIAKLPGSPEDNAAKYLDANRAALKGAKKDNMKALLAEVFATVPPEALTILNERFAAELFNRAADPSQTWSDDQFKKIALDAMKVIQERNAGNDAAGVRDTFAILMFLRASNGTPADLREALINNLPDEESKALARKEWIPPAMGEGQTKTYEPMLAAADAGKQPDEVMVRRISGPSNLESLLAGLGNVDKPGKSATPSLDSILDISQMEMPRMGEDFGLDRVARIRSFVVGGESSGYPGQTIDDDVNKGTVNKAPCLANPGWTQDLKR